MRCRGAVPLRAARAGCGRRSLALTRGRSPPRSRPGAQASPPVRSPAPPGRWRILVPQGLQLGPRAPALNPVESERRHLVQVQAPRVAPGTPLGRSHRGLAPGPEDSRSAPVRWSPSGDFQRGSRAPTGEGRESRLRADSPRWRRLCRAEGQGRAPRAPDPREAHLDPSERRRRAPRRAPAPPSAVRKSDRWDQAPVHRASLATQAARDPPRRAPRQARRTRERGRGAPPRSGQAARPEAASGPRLRGAPPRCAQ